MPDSAPALVLPDTPDWSPARRATVRYALLTGMALTLMGAFGNLWHMPEAIAQSVIQAGTTAILAATASHIGGASLERVGAWWLGRHAT